LALKTTNQPNQPSIPIFVSRRIQIWCIKIKIRTWAAIFTLTLLTQLYVSWKVFYSHVEDTCITYHFTRQEVLVNKPIITQSGELGYRFCHLFVRISYWFRNWCGILRFSIYCTINYITEQLFFWLVIGYIIHIDFHAYRYYYACVCLRCIGSAIVVIV
jgi:hypothetical protein